MTAPPDDRALAEANASLDREKRRNKIAVETHRLMDQYGLSNGDELASALFHMHEDGRRQGAREMSAAAADVVNEARFEGGVDLRELVVRIQLLPLPGDPGSSAGPAQGEPT